MNNLIRFIFFFFIGILFSQCCGECGCTSSEKNQVDLTSNQKAAIPYKLGDTLVFVHDSEIIGKHFVCDSINTNIVYDYQNNDCSTQHKCKQYHYNFTADTGSNISLIFTSHYDTTVTMEYGLKWNGELVNSSSGTPFNCNRYDLDSVLINYKYYKKVFYCGGVFTYKIIFYNNSFGVLKFYGEGALRSWSLLDRK